jgi:hypothetical protein
MRPEPERSGDHVCVNRALILGHRLINEVLSPVPHRQWVFTIPKRLYEVDPLECPTPQET